MMTRRSSFLPPLHLVTSLLLAFILLNVQMYFLARPNAPWLWIDLVAIYAFYVGLEHHTFSAIFKIVVISLAFELNSAVPAGFALMTHLLIMLLGNRIAVWLEMQQRTSQLLLFACLLGFKELLLAATIRAMGPENAQFHSFNLGEYLGMRIPGAFFTVLLAVPLMELFSRFDGFFENRHDSLRH